MLDIDADGEAGEVGEASSSKAFIGRDCVCVWRTGAGLKA